MSLTRRFGSDSKRKSDATTKKERRSKERDARSASKQSERSKLDRHIDSLRVRNDDRDGRNDREERSDDFPDDESSVSRLSQSYDVDDDAVSPHINQESQRRRRERRLARDKDTVMRVVEDMRAGKDVDFDKAVSDIATTVASYIEDTGDEVYDKVRVTESVLRASFEVAKHPDVRGKQADLLSSRPVKLDMQNAPITKEALDDIARMVIARDQNHVFVRTIRIILLTQMAQYPMRINQMRAHTDLTCALTGKRIQCGDDMEFALIDTNNRPEEAHSAKTRHQNILFVPLSISVRSDELFE